MHFMEEEGVLRQIQIQVEPQEELSVQVAAQAVIIQEEVVLGEMVMLLLRSYTDNESFN